MSDLGNVVPIGCVRDRRWHHAIVSALQHRLRHTPECFARGRQRRSWGHVTRDQFFIDGCPWCDHIAAELEAS